LLRVVLGDPERLEFLWEKKVAGQVEKAGKPSMSFASEAFL
jgi:hypothetical protein